MSSTPRFPFLRRACCWALASMLLSALAWAQAFNPFTIRDIRVDGIQRVEIGAVFNYLPVKVGDTFAEEHASAAIQSLYATGFFSDVSLEVDGDVLVLRLKERPTIASVSFNGMREFDANALNEALKGVGFGPGRVFDQAMLEQAEFQLKQQYLSKGKYGVEISPVITPLPRNRVGVNFDIFEGGVATIKEINFIGNQAFSSSRLRDELELTTSGFMTWYTGSDKYSREKLEGDVERIRSFYLDRGYLEFAIEPPQVTISPDRDNIYLTFTLHEGQPYKISAVKLAGDLLGLDAQIQKLIGIKAGDTFSGAKTNETIRALTDYLGTLGYAFANVNPSPTLNRETSEAELTFFVDPGRRVYVRRIQVGGNTRTRDEVVRREMRQQEAAWYDADQLKSSRDRIDRLGYFNEVDVQTEPVPGSPDQIDVLVNVKEKPTGLINLGVGYGSTEKVILSAGISQENIFGSGNSLALQLNTSRTNRTLVLSHTDPYWTGDGISKATSLYYRRTTPYDSSSNTSGGIDGYYRSTALGGGLNFGVPISEADSVFTGVSFEANTLDLYPGNTPLAYQQFANNYGRSTQSVIWNAGWANDTRDSAIAPTQGNYTRISADVSGMDLKYYMFSVQQKYFLPLTRGFTLAFNAGLDWGKTYGGKPFPVTKTVYAGGIGSVRGYEGASLGPRDNFTTGTYLGGARRIIGNVQLYLPFPGASRDRTLRWFMFADAGQVVAGSGTLCMDGAGAVEDPCGWRYSAGLGLSWQSPMGPLELSFGRALNSRRGDDTQAFQFQIGTSF